MPNFRSMATFAVSGLSETPVVSVVPVSQTGHPPPPPPLPNPPPSTSSPGNSQEQLLRCLACSKLSRRGSCTVYDTRRSQRMGSSCRWGRIRWWGLGRWHTCVNPTPTTPPANVGYETVETTTCYATPIVISCCTACNLSQHLKMRLGLLHS